jgi:hypothetical protein
MRVVLPVGRTGPRIFPLRRCLGFDVGVGTLTKRNSFGPSAARFSVAKDVQPRCLYAADD